MRGASADSLATLTDALGAAVDGGADASRVADDLFGASEILRREPGLRRVATDVSVAAEAKAQLVRGIFADRLDPASVELVATATGRHWAGSRDLADALEELGVVAVVRAAEHAGQADDLESELFGYQRLVEDNPQLRDALSDPARSAEDKRALVHDLLDGKVSAAAMRLAEQSITGTYRTVALALEAYQRIAAEHRHRLVATVRVARDLEAEDFERLERVLAEQYGRPVHLNMVIDPDVIGGVKVEIGHDVIDGTVASRLDDARRRLAG
jgi:F-type H+-transporting ATPase subunit delta